MGLCRHQQPPIPFNIYPVKRYLKPITLHKLWLLFPSTVPLPSRAELSTLTFVSQNPTVQGFPLRRNRNWSLASTYGVHLSCSSRQHTLQELSVSEIKQQTHSFQAQRVTCNPQPHVSPGWAQSWPASQFQALLTIKPKIQSHALCTLIRGAVGQSSPSWYLNTAQISRPMKRFQAHPKWKI